MILKELIEYLKSKDPSTKVKVGFNNPHSYRGYYEDLAFEPCNDTTIGEMLNCAEQAQGKEFEGWKGGMFLMRDYTDCWLAREGHSGEGIGKILINYMVGEYNGKSWN